MCLMEGVQAGKVPVLERLLAFSFSSGLQLIGCMLPLLGRLIYFTPCTNSHVHFIPKHLHHRYT